MPWTEEQRKAQSERMKALRARQAAETPPTDPEPVPQPEPVQTPKDTEPAIIPDWRQATRLQVGMRYWTMCDPRCKECTSKDNVPLDWYKHCPHDPYVTMTPVKEPPRYEEIKDEDGNGTGRFAVVDGKIISFTPTPNTRQIPDSPRSNSGHGLEWARRKGFILPSEVRSPLYPNGIADSCMFRDCRTQTGLKRYKTGIFCREQEAQLVWFDDVGKTLEVGEWSNEARQNRINMLATADI